MQNKTLFTNSFKKFYLLFLGLLINLLLLNKNKNEINNMLIQGEFYCEMKFVNFPFDEQVCFVEIAMR